MKSLPAALVSLVVGAALGVVAVVGIGAVANPDKTTNTSSNSPIGNTSSDPYGDVLNYGTNG